MLSGAIRISSNAFESYSVFQYALLNGMAALAFISSGLSMNSEVGASVARQPAIAAIARKQIVSRLAIVARGVGMEAAPSRPARGRRGGGGGGWAGGPARP